MATSMDDISRNNVFPHSVLCSVITSMKYDLVTMFLKMKPPNYHGSKSKNAFEFIISCYQILHKMGIIQIHEV